MGYRRLCDLTFVCFLYEDSRGRIYLKDSAGNYMFEVAKYVLRIFHTFVLVFLLLTLSR